MKICFVAPANNYHTKKWANWFKEHGHEVHVVSFIDDIIPGVDVHFIDTGATADGSDVSKIKYLFHAKELKKVVNNIDPDIVNVHYATSYGTVAALSGIKRYVLSVWGSDIYDFPKKSFFHRLMLKYSLSKATWLFSTSRAMAVEGAKYTKKEFEITPFGVNMTLFNPNRRTRTYGDGKTFVVGTVKGLSDKYGIKTILEAVAILKGYGDIPIQLRIAGKGPQEDEYRELAKKLKIDDVITWLGFISQEEAAKEWANMDVALIPSVMESFGVSAVEAQACGTPVIISDLPGLMEATLPGKTSLIIKVNDKESLAKKVTELWKNQELWNEMSCNGRRYVQKKFDLDTCFYKIEELLSDKVENHAY